MLIQTKRYGLAILLITAVITGGSLALADTAPSPLTTAETTQLQQQLQDIESQIAQYQQQLSQIKGQKNTLQNKINQLKKQQATLSLQIQVTALQITATTNQLQDTQKEIDQTASHAEKLKTQVAQVIKLVYQADDYSLLSVLLSQDDLSSVLNELENYSRLTQDLKSLLDQSLALNKQLTEYRQKLSDQQDENSNLLSIQSLQKKQLAGSVTEQNTLLSDTKGKEANYQAVLSDTQKQAAQIRTRLYQLLGVSTQITFGEAVTIAQWASGLTGVRASFLLAILTQESNLGKNVGTCNRPGDPPEKSWKVVMKPERDQQPFLQITQDLGMDPDTTPVSCPMRDRKGNQVGWGGAMGPAQFIPSTWMGYKDQVAAITGKMANPWDIRDAFLASAIKLKSGGASTPDGEWAAAMRYFSGGTNPKYRFYGDNVIATANRYQGDIDALK